MICEGNVKLYCLMTFRCIQTLNDKLIPISPFLALLGAHIFFHVNRTRAMLQYYKEIKYVLRLSQLYLFHYFNFWKNCFGLTRPKSVQIVIKTVR